MFYIPFEYKLGDGGNIPTLGNLSNGKQGVKIYIEE